MAKQRKLHRKFAAQKQKRHRSMERTVACGAGFASQYLVGDTWIEHVTPAV
jgi:hypothetical protein